MDLPPGKTCGLLNASEVLRGVEGISFVQFDDKDVVRHSLVQKIVLAYERYNKQIGAGRQFALKLGEDPKVEPPVEPADGPVGLEFPNP